MNSAQSEMKKAQRWTSIWAFSAGDLPCASDTVSQQKQTLAEFRSGVKQACGIRESKLSALFELALPKPAAWGG